MTFKEVEKLASLELPDEVYNWLVNFFVGHSLYEVPASQCGVPNGIKCFAEIDGYCSNITHW